MKFCHLLSFLTGTTTIQEMKLLKKLSLFFHENIAQLVLKRFGDQEMEGR
jgi:hypothetical protein